MFACQCKLTNNRHFYEESKGFKYRTGRICLQPNHEEFATSVRDAREGDDGSVEAFTLSSIIAAYGNGRPVDLLKIDVEGANGKSSSLPACNGCPA